MDDDLAESLLERYYEEAAIEGPVVVEFVERALEGRYGPLEPPVIVTFLDRLEVILAGNIEIRLEEAPGQEHAADEALEQVREELGRARQMVAEADV